MRLSLRHLLAASSVSLFTTLAASALAVEGSDDTTPHHRRFGRFGNVELGGAMGISKAGDFGQVTIAPQVGYFFMDNVEISGIVGINYMAGAGGGSTYTTFLAEPSVHVPLHRTVFVFIGMGAGPGYSPSSGTGLALAPRLGANILVGRASIVTPAIQLVYSTTNTVPTGQGALLAVTSSYGVNVGYTVMW